MNSSAIAERAPDATARTAAMDVYNCIVAVSREIAQDGIAKTRSNAQQGYKFRGIDEVMNALSPLLAKHRLVILPRVLSRDVTERATKTGGVLFYVTVEAEFDFVSAADGSKHTVKTYGEAMDSADKATNKAMSAAYKYAAFQTFCIPTEGDNDADAHSHEITSRAPVPVRTAVIEPGRATTAVPSEPNGGDSAISNFVKAAQNPGSDNGPDLGADLPPGARMIVKVGPGRVGAEAEIQFDAPMEGGKDTYLTWKKDVAHTANVFHLQQKPCFVELKKSTSGNYRVERLMAVPDEYLDAPA